MNFGTKLRTVLAIATCLNSALMATDVAQFNNPTADTIYKIASVVLNFIIVALVAYFNNDYTPEGAEGTGYTRALKANNAEIEQNECGEVEPIDDFDSENFEEIQDFGSENFEQIEDIEEV